jgi:DNA-binding GntR family transcriptional regulator
MRQHDDESETANASSVARVQQALRERILSGEYPPGSRLILSKLAEEHGMSFIPIREALHRLESERLVRFARNRGATVTELSMADMRDIYETRLVLEDRALRAAMPQFDATRLEPAELALQEMTAEFGNGDARAAYAAHQRFHFALYEPAGSPWTMHLIQLLWNSAERYLRLAASVRPAPREFVAEHAAILEAVRRGNADEAAARLAANLRTTERLLAATYE